MRREISIAVALMPWLVALPPAVAGPVTIVITNVPDDRGIVRVALCRKDEFLKPYCLYSIAKKATTPSVMVTFREVPAETYAVQVYQDRNNNARLDLSFLGIPLEPVGFSRNPKLKYGPPHFDECAYSLPPEGGTISVRLISK